MGAGVILISFMNPHSTNNSNITRHWNMFCSMKNPENHKIDLPRV